MPLNTTVNLSAVLRTAYLTKRRVSLLLVLLCLSLVILTVMALAMGSESISLPQLWSNSLTPEQQVIIFNIRLPRIALALGAGAALAMAGAAFQALLRNPLADPYVLGVSSGAALGAIVGMMFVSQFAFARPLLSFAGAAAATFVVYLLGRRENDPARLILAGVVVSTLLASLMVLLTTLADDIRLRNITFWLLGDLSGGSSEFIAFLAAAIVIGAGALFSNARALNLMMTGERDAFSLGIETARVRWMVFIMASLLTAAAVSTGGAIGYVGLVVPHLVRLASGSDNRLVLPASALAGALLVLIADTTARTVIAPRELPTGAITALVGAPVLVYLLIGQSRWRHPSGKAQKLKLQPATAASNIFLAEERAAAPATDTLLEINKLSFSYTDLALSNINLEVRPGEVLALLGPNGAGKTTLLNLAAGRLQTTNGAVLLEGKALQNYSRREIAKHIALVAQSDELLFPLTVLEYVLAGRFAHGRGMGFDSSADVEIALQSLALTHAAHFAPAYFNQLSSGQKQQVVLARALAQQPRLLLLDEPTANLDLANQQIILQLVHQLTRQHQLGALLVTHEINLAAQFADRTALIKDGRIIACDLTKAVLTEEAINDLFNL